MQEHLNMVANDGNDHEPLFKGFVLKSLSLNPLRFTASGADKSESQNVV